MSRKKPKSEKDKLYEQNVKKPQSYEVPLQEEHKNFSRVYKYMTEHDNFLALSGNAVKVYVLMRTEIWEDIDDYAKTKTFDFSANSLDKAGIMSKKTVIRAMKELEHYGFIRKENNATYQSGMTQRWSFSDEWYRRIYKKYDAE